MESELHYSDVPAVGFMDRRAKVWLECNGEPYDRRSVRVIGSGDLARRIPFLRFVCPRCGRTHESLLFR